MDGAERRQHARMEHHRLRKCRGPETWVRVRAACVAGESAPSDARRFDVGLSNLRRRAMAEGWTRNRIAEQLDLKPLRGGADDPPPAFAPLSPAGETAEPPCIDPEVAVQRALMRAAGAVAEVGGDGRRAEAGPTPITQTCAAGPTATLISLAAAGRSVLPYDPLAHSSTSVCRRVGEACRMTGLAGLSGRRAISNGLKRASTGQPTVRTGTTHTPSP